MILVGDSIDLSENTKNKFIGSGKGSIIGLGAIPPSADKGALDGVSVRGIVSSRVLSFTMLRTFHFGKGVEGDAAIRALIAAALLRAMAGYDENPVVRANCALTETGKPSVVLNKRYGEKEEFEPLTAESTEKLLEEAYMQAREKAGIVWNGQELRCYGERLQYSVFFLRIRPAKMLVVQNLIEVEIDGSTDSVVVCFLGKEEQAREGMSFLGRREYSDLTIPTVI